jgi:hypothetical protein
MEARGFLAGARVRFANTQLTKSPPSVGEPTAGQSTYLSHESPTAKPQRRSRAFSDTTAIAFRGCIFNVNENGRRTISERGVMQRSSSGTPLVHWDLFRRSGSGVAFFKRLQRSSSVASGFFVT